MSIPINADCYLCQMQRYVELANQLGDEKTAAAFTKDLMALYHSAPEGVSSPWFTPAINELLQIHFHTEKDRYREEKAQSNAFVLPIMDEIRSRAEAAEDRVYAGLQYAILGNYIDFSALRGEVSFAVLEKMLESANRLSLDKAVFARFCADLQAGKELLYITDNAGEIGFDRIFAELLQSRYPHLKITFLVRGGPAQNDATREDALAVGVSFPILDNGNAIPGTDIASLSPEAKEALEQADVIFSKGQGNVETLFGCGYNVYYAFLVKCPRFVALFQKEKLSPMLLRERQ